MGRVGITSGHDEDEPVVCARNSEYSILRFKEGSEAAGILVLGHIASSEMYRARAFIHLEVCFSSLLQ